MWLYAVLLGVMIWNKRDSSNENVTILPAFCKSTLYPLELFAILPWNKCLFQRYGSQSGELKLTCLKFYALAWSSLLQSEVLRSGMKFSTLTNVNSKVAKYLPLWPLEALNPLGVWNAPPMSTQRLHSVHFEDHNS